MSIFRWPRGEYKYERRREIVIKKKKKNKAREEREKETRCLTYRG